MPGPFELRRDRDRGRPQRAGHRVLPGARRAARPRARAAPRRRRRLCHRGDLSRLQGLHRRVREQPLPHGDRPRPEAGLLRVRGPPPRPRIVHAVSRRALLDDGPRRRPHPQGDRQVQRARRRALSAVRGDARARRGGGRAHADDGAARSVEAAPPRPPDAALTRTFVPAAGRRGRRGGGDPHRRRAADPRPLVRVGGVEGDAGDRRGHRGDGSPLDAGDRVRAVPPRDGRERRRARCLGVRARRHGRADAGARGSRPRPRRRHSLRGRGGAHPGARRQGRRRGARRRRRVPRPGRGEQRRRQRDVPAAARPEHTSGGVRGRRRADQLRERLAEDQRRPGGAAGLPRAAGHRAQAPSTAAPSTSVPTRTTSSAPSTTPSTAGPLRSPCSSARSRRPSTRPSRRPVVT